MQDELRSLVEQPTAENYRRLRAHLLASAAPASLGDLMLLGEECAAGRMRRAEKLLARIWSSWLLSPRLHYWAAIVAEARHDADDGELERCLFTTCLDALLDTGRGDERSPYLVTYLTDVSDLLEARKLRPIERRLVAWKDGFCDVVRCQGDRLVWCDVTELVNRSGHTVVEAALCEAVAANAPSTRRKALSPNH